MWRQIVGVVLLGCVGTAFAVTGERGSPEEARVLAERAARVLEASGSDRDQVLERFIAPSTEFVDRDLYVFVLDLEGTLHAHGDNARLVGKSMIKLKDIRGQYIARNAIDTAIRNQAGWTPEYHFPGPISRKIGVKQSYVIKVGDLVVGVGFYKPS